MLFGVIMFGLGLSIGTFVLALLKLRVVRKAFDVSKQFGIGLAIAGIGAYLFWQNWTTFTSPPRVDTWAKFEKIVFDNTANEAILLLGTFFGLLGLLSYIIRVPFSNWTQVKLFGVFEATRVVEKAKDEFQAIRALEYNRVLTLSTLTSTLGLNAIADRFTGHEFEVDTLSIMKDLSDDIVDGYFKGGVRIHVRSGFLVSDAEIPTDVPKASHKAIRILRKSDGTKAMRHRNEWGEAGLAVRIVLGPVAYDLWLSSNEYAFVETDESFLTAIKNVVEYNLQRAVLSKVEQEISAILEN